VTGRFTYIAGLQTQGHGTRARGAAAQHEGYMQNYNEWECRKIPGYVGVVRKGNFLAVVARPSGQRSRPRVPSRLLGRLAGSADKAKLWEYVTCNQDQQDEDLQKVGNARRR